MQYDKINSFNNQSGNRTLIVICSNQLLHRTVIMTQPLYNNLDGVLAVHQHCLNPHRVFDIIIIWLAFALAVHPFITSPETCTLESINTEHHFLKSYYQGLWHLSQCQNNCLLWCDIQLRKLDLLFELRCILQPKDHD